MTLWLLLLAAAALPDTPAGRSAPESGPGQGQGGECPREVPALRRTLPCAPNPEGCWLPLPGCPPSVWPCTRQGAPGPKPRAREPPSGHGALLLPPPQSSFEAPPLSVPPQPPGDAVLPLPIRPVARRVMAPGQSFLRSSGSEGCARRAWRRCGGAGRAEGGVPGEGTAQDTEQKPLE